MTYPIFEQQGAIDLGSVKALAAMRESHDAEIERTRYEQEVVDWDRRMTRAFKGIFSRPKRIAFMRAAVKADERGAS